MQMAHPPQDLPDRLTILKALQDASSDWGSDEPFPEIFQKIATQLGSGTMNAKHIFHIVMSVLVPRFGEVWSVSIDDLIDTIPQWFGFIPNPVRQDCYSLFEEWVEDPNKFSRNKPIV